MTQDHRTTPATRPCSNTDRLRHRRSVRGVRDEDGSLITEYGLLAVVAATIAGVVIQWASGGAIVRLFNALVNAARDLVGA